MMNQPAHIANFTADNAGIMTLQGTNQYIVGKDSAVVIDVALSSDGNMDGIIEQGEAMGVKKIEKIEPPSTNAHKRRTSDGRRGRGWTELCVERVTRFVESRKRTA